jgi:hypothetical protein
MTAAYVDGFALNEIGGGISQVVAHITRGDDRARRPGATAPIPTPPD